jgi:hypothetical protein
MVGKAIKSARSQHLDELGAILKHWARLSSTPAPYTPPPSPEAKLEQQLNSPIAQEASESEPIVDTRRKGAPFADRGFSERTIRNMVASRIDAPERLLHMTETQLKKIQGVGAKSIEEIRAYRARFIPGGSLPRIQADSVAMDNKQLIGLFLFGVFAGFVAYVFVALIF